MKRTQTVIPEARELFVYNFLQQRGAKKMRDLCAEAELTEAAARTALQRLRLNGKVSRRKEWDGWVWYAR